MADIIYKARYKCRLCGEIYEGGATTGNRDIAVKSMIKFVTGNDTMTQAPTLYDIHFCKHSNIGIADFIGWQAKVGK